MLESEEAQQLVERVAEAPEVRSAITSQGVGLLEDVRRSAREFARNLDDAFDRWYRRLRRRPARAQRPLEAGAATRLLAIGLDAADPQRDPAPDLGPARDRGRRALRVQRQPGGEDRLRRGRLADRVDGLPGRVLDPRRADAGDDLLRPADPRPRRRPRPAASGLAPARRLLPLGAARSGSASGESSPGTTAAGSTTASPARSSSTPTPRSTAGSWWKATSARAGSASGRRALEPTGRRPDHPRPRAGRGQGRGRRVPGQRDLGLDAAPRVAAPAHPAPPLPGDDPPRLHAARRGVDHPGHPRRRALVPAGNAGDEHARARGGARLAAA